MRTTYAVTCSIPAIEAPGLFRHFTIEITRPYTLTKRGIEGALQDQLENQEVLIIDYKQVKSDARQFDLFLPVPDFQSNPGNTKAVVIRQEKSGKFSAFFHTGEDLTPERKKELGKPEETKRSIRLSTVTKWARSKIAGIAEQLSLTGV